VWHSCFSKFLSSFSPVAIEGQRQTLEDNNESGDYLPRIASNYLKVPTKGNDKTKKVTALRRDYHAVMIVARIGRSTATPPILSLLFPL